MSDRMPCHLTIGGAIAAGDVTTLVAAILLEGPCLGEYDGVPVDKENLREEIAAAIADGTCLDLYEVDATDGQLAEVTKVCRDLGLSYCSHSCASVSYDAGFAWWRPGMAAEMSSYASDDGDPLVAIASVRLALRDEGAGVAAIVALLDRYDPPAVPPLSWKPDPAATPPSRYAKRRGQHVNLFDGGNVGWIVFRDGDPVAYMAAEAMADALIDALGG